MDSLFQEYNTQCFPASSSSTSSSFYATASDPFAADNVFAAPDDQQFSYAPAFSQPRAISFAQRQFNSTTNIPRRFLTQQQLQNQSPALSTRHSIDESIDLSDTDCSSTLLSWGSSSLGGTCSSMTSSPLNTQQLATNVAGPWLDPCGPVLLTDSLCDTDPFGLDSAICTDFQFDVALDNYDAGHRFPAFNDSLLIDPIPSPPLTNNNFLQHGFPILPSAHPLSPALSMKSGGPLSANSQFSRSASPHHAQWLAHASHTGSPQVSFQPMTARATPQPGSVEGEDDVRSRNRCPYPDCGKVFKDLKAHMLTHQDERPEKCPIPSCEFHKRGFARKYDRNRHLVTTHYKSTIVCGFCPGSGSSSEKSFNRTDVFKRHLVAVHGVEQTPPNGRKKSPTGSGRQSPALPDGTTGKCSTCGVLFTNAQDLFEHLDDCVLRVVQQVDPAEANNEKLLMSVAEDEDVKNTIKIHGLDDADLLTGDEDDEDIDGADDASSSAAGRKSKLSKQTPSHRPNGVRDGRITKPNSTKQTPLNGKLRAGLTFSKGGVALNVGKSQRRRREYPRSWGCSSDKMKLKKRVLCVFDGQRRLWKDDMMLGNDQEVRVKLADGESYVTDLDVQSVKRAEALHGATDDERGPWIPTNMLGVDYEPLVA